MRGGRLSSEVVTFPVNECRRLARVVISPGNPARAYMSLNASIEDRRLLTNSKYLKNVLNL
jgi:hypothetical protein